MVGEKRRNLSAFAGGALALVGLVLVLGSVLAMMSNGQRWWWEPEANVPRDGATHTVTVGQPGGRYAVWSDASLVDPQCSLSSSAGREIDNVSVPKAERIRLDEPWAAQPEASSTFTAPADGVVVATCVDVDVTPVQSLHLAPMHSHLYYSVMQYGGVLGGLVLLVGGVALAVVRAVRGRRPEREAVGVSS